MTEPTEPPASNRASEPAARDGEVRDEDRPPKLPGLGAVVLRKATRAGLVGAMAGLFVSVVGQVAVYVAERGMAGGPRTAERVMGAILSTSMLGALTFVTAALALTMSGVRRARRGGGAVTVAVVTAVATVLVLFYVFALALRLLIGSNLTMTGIEFFMNSAGHILNAVAAKYLGYVALVVLVAGVVSASFAFALRRALRSLHDTVRRAETAAALTMCMLTAGALSLPLPTALGRGVASSSPELALLTSMTIPKASPRGMAGMHGLVEQALTSPPRSALLEWQLATKSTGRRPNVVVITLESVAASHCGFLGYNRPTTPNLDALAEDGLVMTRAYTTATHSNYAQMAVISSLFPRRGTQLDMYQRLDYPRVLLHDLGHDLGYSTATISSQDETWQGMKRFEDTGTPTFFRHALDYKGEHLDLGTEDVAPDQTTAAQVAKFIDAHANERFTVYVNFQSTHFPYPIPKDAPRPFQPWEPKGTFNYVRWEREELPTIVNRYDDALAYVDAQIGVIMASLKTHHLKDDTIVVVTSDHGEMFFDHDLVTHGRTLFEGETRVPLVVSYPATVTPGEDATPVSTLDVLPTIVDLMDLPPHPAFQGESFARVRDGAKPTGAVFMNIQGWKHYDAIVCMPYKLIYDPDSAESELFDLVKDPGESVNLVNLRQDVADTLFMTLRAQLDAQESYHADDDRGHALRSERFAPRMLPCPALP